MEISVADHVQRAARSNFAAGWDELGATNELEDTFALAAMNTLEEAVAQITQFLGMHPCDRSDRVPDGKSSHTLYLAGKEHKYINHVVWLGALMIKTIDCIFSIIIIIFKTCTLNIIFLTRFRNLPRWPRSAGKSKTSSL